MDIPFDVWLKSKLEKLKTPILKSFQVIDIIFHIICIYIIAVFLGAENSVLTGLASIGFYFLFQEISEHIRGWIKSFR